MEETQEKRKNDFDLDNLNSKKQNVDISVYPGLAREAKNSEEYQAKLPCGHMSNFPSEEFFKSIIDAFFIEGGYRCEECISMPFIIAEGFNSTASGYRSFVPNLENTHSSSNFVVHGQNSTDSGYNSFVPNLENMYSSHVVEAQRDDSSRYVLDGKPKTYSVILGQSIAEGNFSYILNGQNSTASGYNSFVPNLENMYSSRVVENPTTEISGVSGSDIREPTGLSCPSIRGITGVPGPPGIPYIPPESENITLIRRPVGPTGPTSPGGYYYNGEFIRRR